MKTYCSIKMPPSLAEKKKRETGLSGAVHIFTLGILLVIFAACGGYLYSVNRSAVQGYRMRVLEREIDKLKTENAEFKIVEADLRSLYRIEASEEALAMQKPENIIYIEERGIVSNDLGGPVALK